MERAAQAARDQAAREAEASAAALMSALTNDHVPDQSTEMQIKEQLTEPPIQPQDLPGQTKTDNTPIIEHMDSDSARSSPSEDLVQHSEDTVATTATSSVSHVYVDPPAGSLPLTHHLSCHEPPDMSHSGRDPADLQAAQGLADLQRGQSLSLSNDPSGSASSSMTFMVNELQEVSGIRTRICL